MLAGGSWASAAAAGRVPPAGTAAESADNQPVMAADSADITFFKVKMG